MFLDKGDFPLVEKENIDLVVETPDATIGIQVETGKSDIKRNIHELSELNPDHKFMVATNAKAKQKIEKILANQKGRDDIRVFLGKDFLTDPLPLTLTEKDSGKS